MSPPRAGHRSGNSSPTRDISFAQAIREVSCERGFAIVSQQPRQAADAGGREDVYWPVWVVQAHSGRCKVL